LFDVFTEQRNDDDDDYDMVNLFAFSYRIFS